MDSCEYAADLQRKRIWVRRRKGAQNERMELSGIRGAVELRLSARNGAFRALRTWQGEAPNDGRRWLGGDEGTVRGVRLRRRRAKSTNAVQRAGNQAAHRFVVPRHAVSAATKKVVRRKQAKRSLCPSIARHAWDLKFSEIHVRSTPTPGTSLRPGERERYELAQRST